MKKDPLQEALRAHLSNDLERAFFLYKQAIKEGSKDPIAFANLGFIYKSKGDLRLALSMTLKASNISPSDATILSNLGGIYKDLGDHEKALQKTRESLILEPNNPLALSNLGNILQLQGSYQQALEALSASAQLNPNNSTTFTIIGITYQSIGQTEHATSALNKALNLDPKNTAALNHLCSIKILRGELDIAKKISERSAFLSPKCPEAIFLKGKIQQASGDIKNAEIYFHKSLSLNPNHTESLFQLSLNLDSTEKATLILEKSNQIDPRKTPKAQLPNLYLGAANCYHKLHNFKKSSVFLEKANNILIDLYPSEAPEVIRITNKFLFNNNEPKEKPDPQAGKGLIFIVGMPRSGSTLLETVLAANPMVRDLGESDALPYAVERIKTLETSQNNGQTLLDLYKSKLCQASIKHTFITDKQLSNYRYTEVIAKHLPSAKIIHCKRNPLDNILSMLRAKLSFGYNYTASPNDSASVLINQEMAMREYKNRHPNSIYTFNYDSFVNNPESTLKHLTKWLNLEWHDNYLLPEKAKRTILTFSVIQARQPINRRSLGGWKNYQNLLEEPKEKIIQSHLFEDFNL